MGGEFCPRCGQERVGNFRFCRSCGFDFESAPESQPPDRREGAPPGPVLPPAPPPVARSFSEQYASTPFGAPATGPTAPAPPPAKRAGSRGPLVIAAGLVLVAAVAAIALGSRVGSGAGQSPSPGASSAFNPTPVPSETIFVTEAPVITPAPSSGLYQASLKSAVSITCDGQACMDVTVDQVKTASIYKDPQGYLNDTPDTKGDVFMAVHVTYKATGPNADYNVFDWGLYVNDTAVSYPAMVLNGPKPELDSGQLPVGKTAAGWVVWEVPAKGRVTLIYQPGRSAVFEVTLRS